MNRRNTGAGRASSDVTEFSDRDICNATNNFSSSLIIGDGGFGTVYKAKVGRRFVAIKILKTPNMRQFITELETLIRFEHENLLSIIGYCDDLSFPCLVLEYMANGSLEYMLENKPQKLPWDLRLNIAYGSALGINYLHTSGMVHRDIKSANILLSKDFVPKVADFGMVRFAESGNSRVQPVTYNCYYTPYYVAPEVYEGDVSVKQDSFSFGVVLLELLTGKKPFYPYPAGKPLREYSKAQILNMLLDERACWDESPQSAERLYNVARRCVIENKATRPTISTNDPCFLVIAASEDESSSD